MNPTGNSYTLNTSEWHVYRIVLQTNHTKYEVYIDDIKEPVLATGNTVSKSDPGGVYFGGETADGACNMDIEYTKMGTGDYYEIYNASLSFLSVDAGTLIPAFSPSITEYVCELFTADPNTVTPSATPASALAQVAGLDPVDVSSGTAVSTIEVAAGDGETTRTYTIRYVQTGNTDYTSFIINNDFDYVAEGVLWNDNSNPNYPKFPNDISTFVSNCFRPVIQNDLAITVDTHAEFYGWKMSDWNFLFTNANGTTPTQSIGIGGGNNNFHISTAMWLAGNNSMSMPENFEFYQIVDKDNISAGTYKVTCILGIQSDYHTSQRLFANQNVQFYGKEANYVTNKTEGEIYSYAGYAPTGSADDGRGMKVYVTVSEGDSIKLGLRSGKNTGDGRTPATGNVAGWFKVDYFTLTKINPSVATDASLSDITLSIGDINFSPEIDTYNVTLPTGTTTVSPTATTNVADASVSGAEAVDVTSGSGTSTIVVTALDGSTQKTYIINYTILPTGIDTPSETKVFCFTDGRKLTVQGVEAYTVYGINGVKIAEVTANPAGTTIDLLPGVYVVKTKTAGAFKVIVK
jgi:hypothetical protein